jgi:hypothetical protein
MEISARKRKKRNAKTLIKNLVKAKKKELQQRKLNKILKT